jgi:hypothetical protein
LDETRIAGTCPVGTVDDGPKLGQKRLDWFSTVVNRDGCRRLLVRACGLSDGAVGVQVAREVVPGARLAVRAAVRVLG